MATAITISGLITSGISLSLPTTISSTGTVESTNWAAVTDGAGYGTLTNQGDINGDIFGISLANGGTITNLTGAEIYGVSGIDISGRGGIDNFGTISGDEIGIILGTAALTNEITGRILAGAELTSGTLTNEGTIARATGDIISFSDGGTVLNLGSAAALTGGAVVGVAIGGAAGEVFNQGSISGISMAAGGAVTNAGYITTGADDFGVVISRSSGYIENTGHIVGAALYNGGLLVNAAGGIVSGYIDGLDLAAGGTVTNNGSILGIGGRFSSVDMGRDGISFSGSAAILNNAGALIKGSNDGIILSGTEGGSATITNRGTIIGKRGVVINAPVSTTLIDYGTITGTGGTAVAFEEGNDTLVLEPGAVVNGIVVGGDPGNDVSLTIDGSLTSETGGIELAVGGNLIVTGSMAASETISFAGTDATLMIGNASKFLSEITGMAGNDTIDLMSESFDRYDQVFLTTNNVLEIVGNGTMSLQLDPTQSFHGEFFHISSDGLNGTDVTESAVPCFLQDTRIATDTGDITVQALKIGDMVLTSDGLAKPVKWIGRRSYPASLPDDPDIIPVLIKADALGPNVPAADLYLSPRHAVRVDGFLVPAGALINGVSVLSCPEISPIVYYHIELDAHDTVFANGAEAETFIDHDSRKMFDNAEEYYRLYPQGWATNYTLCAPRLEFGGELEAVRRGIAFRAGVLLDQALGNTVIGFLEKSDRQTITGWAYAPAQPHVPVSLDIFNRGALLARAIANIPRPDVRNAGFGHGRCGFSITLPAPLPALMRHEISVRPAGNMDVLAGSPIIIDPGIAHDLLKTGGLKTLIDAAVQGLGSDGEVAELGNSLEAAGRHIRLAAQPAKPAAARITRNGIRPVVLMLDTAWPTINRDAGSNAIMSHVDGFLRLGHDVAFCASGGAPDNDDAADGLRELQRRGVRCFGQDGTATEETIRVLAAQGLNMVYLHRLAAASAYGGIVRRHAPRARVIYSVADLHHLRLERQAKVCDRPDLAAKAKSVKAAELWAMQLADYVITHSRFEASYLRQEAPRANVHLVPWAVEPAARLGAGRGRRDIAFIGGAGHAPNLDAVTHLARQIMPLVWAAEPSIRCLVAGLGWTGNLFNSFDTRMVNLGQVPDLPALLRTVKLTVAPLRFGAGIKGKVLDSMAAGTPCAMSEVAAEGLPLDLHLQGLVGDGDAFARHVLDVYSDKKLNRVAAQAGLDMIETCFSRNAVDDALARMLGQPAAKREHVNLSTAPLQLA